MSDHEAELARMKLEHALRTLRAAPESGAQRAQKKLHPKERRRLRRRKWLFLGAGIALVAVGALWSGHQAIVRPPETSAKAEAATPADPPVSAEDLARIHAVSRVLESKYPRAATARWEPEQRNESVERERVLKSLEVDGKAPRFFTPLDLKLPADGKPFNCYCLLHAPLDEATEADWAQAGMLRRESEIINPFLRYVTIDNAEALRRVTSGSVYRVAYSLCPPPE